MILTVGNTKGGTGKTTVAVNLAVRLVMYGWNVLLVDGDEQGTAMAFTELREDPENYSQARYTAVALHGSAIRSQARRLRPSYDHIVIDVGGRDSGSLRAALTVSDLVLIPTAPRSFDLWGVDSTADLVREAREINSDLSALAVLNGADPAGKDNGEALEALGEIEGLLVSPCRLGRRKAYPNAAAAGLSIFEYTDRSNPDGVLKARQEFDGLVASMMFFPRRSIA